MEGPAQECGTGRPNAGAIPDAKRRQGTPRVFPNEFRFSLDLFHSLYLFECLPNLFIFLDSVPDLRLTSIERSSAVSKMSSDVSRCQQMSDSRLVSRELCNQCRLVICKVTAFTLSSTSW